MQKSESITKVMAALGQFQEAAVKIRKDSKNPFFKSKYASLSAILDEIQPELTKAKLAFTQLPQGSTHLETVLCHWESGEFISSNYDLNCVQSMSPEWGKIVKDFSIDCVPQGLGTPIITPQALGSAITYARRYALTSILGLNIDDDDDGNAASGNNSSQPQQPAAKQNGQPAPAQQPAPTPQTPAVQQTPYNKQYTDINAIIAVAKSAAKVEELTQLYRCNQELVDKNQSIKDAIATRRDHINNQGKAILTDGQFTKLCDRISKGDAAAFDSAKGAFVLNGRQTEELERLNKQRILLEEALALKYNNPADIANLIEQCTTTEYVMKLHSNNAFIIDRDPELHNKINGKLKTLKPAA